MNYPEVKALKRELLESAWKRFHKGDGRGGRAKLFAKFLDRHSAWLPDYTLYRVLLEATDGLEDLSRWPLSRRSAAAAHAWLAGLPAKERGAIEERRLFFAYVQWIAFSQWSSVADLAEVLGVALIGDVPVGVAAGGADVRRVEIRRALRDRDLGNVLSVDIFLRIEGVVAGVVDRHAFDRQAEMVGIEPANAQVAAIQTNIVRGRLDHARQKVDELIRVG